MAVKASPKPRPRARLLSRGRKLNNKKRGRPKKAAVVPAVERKINNKKKSQSALELLHAKTLSAVPPQGQHTIVYTLAYAHTLAYKLAYRNPCNTHTHSLAFRFSQHLPSDRNEGVSVVVCSPKGQDKIRTNRYAKSFIPFKCNYIPIGSSLMASLTRSTSNTSCLFTTGRRALRNGCFFKLSYWNANVTVVLCVGGCPLWLQMHTGLLRVPTTSYLPRSSTTPLTSC